MKSILVFIIGVFIFSGIYAQKKEDKDKINPKKEAEFKSNFYQAIKAFHLDNFDIASEKLEACEKIYNDRAAVYHFYAKIGKAEKNNQEWRVQAQKAYGLEPNNHDYVVDLLDALEENREWQLAFDIAQDYVKTDALSDKQAVYFQEKQAYYLVRLRKTDKAVSIYQDLINEYGEQERFLISLKRLYEFEANHKGQISVLEKLQKAYPNNEAYLFELAEQYVVVGEKEKAVDMLKAISGKKGIGATSANLLLAKFYYGEQSVELGLEYLDKASQFPFPETAKAVGIIRKMGIPNSKMSEEELNVMVKMAESNSQSPQVNYLCAEALSGNGYWEKATTYYLRAHQLNENDFTFQVALIEAQYNANQFAQLELSTESAMESYPNQPLTYLYNGLAKINLKKYDDAYEILTEGKMLVIDNPNLLQQFELSLADCEHYTGNYSASDARFDRLLEKNPNNATVLNNYAYFLALRNQKLNEAVVMSKKSLSLEPENAVFMDTYGWVLFKQAKFNESVDWLQKAAKLGADIGEIHLHLGDVLAKNGNITEALVHWKKAKELGETSDLLNKKILNKQYYE